MHDASHSYAFVFVYVNSHVRNKQKSIFYFNFFLKIIQNILDLQYERLRTQSQSKKFLWGGGGGGGRNTDVKNHTEIMRMRVNFESGWRHASITHRSRQSSLYNRPEFVSMLYEGRFVSQLQPGNGWQELLRSEACYAFMQQLKREGSRQPDKDFFSHLVGTTSWPVAF